MNFFFRVERAWINFLSVWKSLPPLSEGFRESMFMGVRLSV